MSLKFNEKKNLLPFLLVISIYLLGLICGLILNDMPGFSLKKEISIGDVFILGLTWYIASILNKNLNNQRSEKDMLIKSIDKFQADLLALKEYIDQAKKSQSRISKEEAGIILQKTRHTSKTLSILFKNLRQYKNERSIKITMDQLEDNQKKFWKYVTANLTNTPPKITKTNYALAENIFYQYIGNLTKLSLDLNNS